MYIVYVVVVLIFAATAMHVVMLCSLVITNLLFACFSSFYRAVVF